MSIILNNQYMLFYIFNYFKININFELAYKFIYFKININFDLFII